MPTSPMPLSWCAEPPWISELDLGHAGGFEFMLGRCGACSAHWMHVFATPANAESYVPVASNDVERMRAAAQGPDRKALMSRWAADTL